MCYDDHEYCEVCDKHSRTCWCWSSWHEEPDVESATCQNKEHEEK